MAVIIQNVSEGPMTGLQQYIVRINSDPVVATFEHIREDGLAECLRKAADAVEAVSAATREASSKTVRDPR
jgi:hypothetical protein